MTYGSYVGITWDYDKPLYTRISSKQPGFNGKYLRVFLVARVAAIE